MGQNRDFSRVIADAAKGVSERLESVSNAMRNAWERHNSENSTFSGKPSWLSGNRHSISEKREIVLRDLD